MNKLAVLAATAPSLLARPCTAVAAAAVPWECPEDGGKPVYGWVMDGAGPIIVNGAVYVHSGQAGRSTANVRDLRGQEGHLAMASRARHARRARRTTEFGVR